MTQKTKRNNTLTATTTTSEEDNFMNTTTIKKTSKKNRLIYAALVAASMMGVIGSTQTLAHAKGNTDPTSSNVITTSEAQKALKEGDMSVFTKSVKVGNQLMAVGDYLTSISDGTAWINTLAADQLDAWDALALVRSSTGLTDNQKDAIHTTIENNYATGATHSNTDYARDVIGLVAIGVDPTTEINGTNLLSEVYTAATNSDADIYTITDGILALTAAQGYVDNTSEINELITNLIQMQTEQGTGFFTDEYGYTIDTTGMALQALAPYFNKGNASVDNAVNIAAEALGSTVQDDGNFKDPLNDTADVNSSSDAMAITGLAACGFDPENYTTDVSPIDALLSYQVAQGQTDAGSFNWTTDLTYSRQMSTQQAVYALDQYDFLKNNKTGSIFDFVTNPV